MHVDNFFAVKQVFSDMDFFGWYTCGDVPDDGDILIHKQICDINECPVLMKLNPLSRNEGVSFNVVTETVLILIFF